MTAAKTNERPGTRAQARHVRMSATKARAVLDLIRGKDVRTADEILQFSERDAAIVVRKVLASAIANAEHNDDQIGDDLYVATAYADEGRTMRRFRPRARGRATRIRKRSCHITIIVARLSEDELEKRRNRDASRPGSRAARRAGQQAAEERKRRTRRSRKGADQPDAAEVAEAESAEGIVDQQAPAVAQAEAALGESTTDEPAATDVADAVEAEGIVDQQAEALADAEAAGDVSAADEEEGR
jgi:large subunit ribosomal protein L22